MRELFSVIFGMEKILIYDELLVTYILSNTKMITNRNPGRTQEMMTSAHKIFDLVLIVVVKS